MQREKIFYSIAHQLSLNLQCADAMIILYIPALCTRRDEFNYTFTLHVILLHKAEAMS